MIFRKKYFRGGVHPNEKELTAHKKIEPMKKSKFYYVTNLQHIGVPSEIVVKKGEKVKKYQLLGKATENFSAPIHSPCSGKVVEIKEILLKGRKVKEVKIENDFLEEHEKIHGLKEINIESFQKKIKELGIVGLGGATFPTHIKLVKGLDYLIVNGAECEPYLNADNRTMIEETSKVIKGIELILNTFEIGKAIIGIENNKKEAIEKLKEKLKTNKRIELKVLPTIYPQGGEKQLIKAILNKEVKSLPNEVKALTLNVGTIVAIFKGITYGVPLVERIVTVSGEKIPNCKNLSVLIGTPIEDILEYVGLSEYNNEDIITCGPMMGHTYKKGEAITKGMNGVLALEEVNFPKPLPCIKCGRCVDVCPMGLIPLEYPIQAKKEKFEKMEKDYSLSSCIKCGSCEFICPSQVPIMEAIFLGVEKGRKK